MPIGSQEGKQLLEVPPMPKLVKSETPSMLAASRPAGMVGAEKGQDGGLSSPIRPATLSPQCAGSPNLMLQDGREALPRLGGLNYRPTTTRRVIPLVKGLLCITEPETGRKHTTFDIPPYQGSRSFKLRWWYGQTETFTTSVCFGYPAMVRQCAPVRARKKLMEGWKP